MICLKPLVNHYFLWYGYIRQWKINNGKKRVYIMSQQLSRQSRGRAHKSSTQGVEDAMRIQNIEEEKL